MSYDPAFMLGALGRASLELDEHRRRLASAERAMQLYERSCGQPWLRCLAGVFVRRFRALPSLAEARASVAHDSLNAHYAGTRTVPINLIRGSEDRGHDYDADFRPRAGSKPERWLSIAAARLEGVPLPAVELIQVSDAYYVRDGHHRISVARALGEEYIEASVTVWELEAA